MIMMMIMSSGSAQVTLSHLVPRFLQYHTGREGRPKPEGEGGEGVQRGRGWRRQTHTRNQTHTHAHTDTWWPMAAQIQPAKPPRAKLKAKLIQESSLCQQAKTCMWLVSFSLLWHRCRNTFLFFWWQGFLVTDLINSTARVSLAEMFQWICNSFKSTVDFFL